MPRSRFRPETSLSPRQLEAFDVVASTGSLSAAAAVLGLTQPALTNSLNQLEALLGVSLFERTPAGTFPNAAGAIFHRRTMRFFDQIRAGVAIAISTHGEDSKRARTIVARISRGHMRNLIAIWRTGGFRAAAETLGLSDPGLQRPARDLERLLGVGLYRRTPVGLAVNETGAGLARRLALALDEIALGAQEIGAAAAIRASLRVGVLPLSPRTPLAHVTDTLLEGHRSRRIEVFEGSYEQLARDLHDGALDLIFGALRAPAPYPDMLEEELFEDPYRIVCRRDHPLTGIPSPAVSDIARYEWIFPTQGMPRRTALNEFLAAGNLSKDIQIETSCLSTIVALLAGSDRISLLSHWHIALDKRSELAGIEHVHIPHARRCIGLTMRAGWLPTPFQNGFLESLRTATAKLATLPSEAKGQY